jgi:general L-amino acid transport system permease protein
MAEAFQSIPARAPPVRTGGALPWLRRNLFGDWKSALATVFLIGLALIVLPRFGQWAVTNAVLGADADACQAARGSGAAGA